MKKHPAVVALKKEAENKMLAVFTRRRKIKLKSNPLKLKNCRVELDGFSREPPTLVEVCARVGKIKIE